MQNVGQAPRLVGRLGLVDKLIEVALVGICAAGSIYGLIQISVSG